MNAVERCVRLYMYARNDERALVVITIHSRLMKEILFYHNSRKIAGILV